jgi:IclR family acetate operon transcriptional repressor
MGVRSLAAQAEPAKVLVKAGAIIDALGEHGALGPAELAEVVGLPRSTVYRLVDGLAAAGLAAVATDGRIGLAMGWLQLGQAAHRSLTEWNGAHVILEELAERTGQTAYLTVLRGTDCVCIDWARGRGIDALILRPDRTLPLHAGGAGRVALAHLPDEQIEEYLKQAPFEAYTDFTLIGADDLRRDAEQTRTQGYALSAEDVTIGVGAVGVAVFDPGSGQSVGSVSLAGFIDDIVATQESLAAELSGVSGRLLNSER